MALSPQWLDELRSRITLSSVIMRTTRLTKAGREWKACCPFHDEKTPSFTVNDEKGFYHCFGCGAHGDAIRWMTDQRGLPFMDAVKELATEAGMEVPRPDPREAKRAEQRAGLTDAMQAAQDWFRQNLLGDGGAAARKYLESRGFGPEIEKEFGFGLAPENRQAMKGALTHFDEAMLIEAGLRIRVEGKEPYDRFRGRLMLPIHNMRGRVIAFGGRILSKDTDAPKYLNSPDTPLFDKGRTLYNIHRAGPASRKTGRLVVVEGYMDVVALAAAGIADVVAPLGTALTENQLRLLWRLVDAPVLCFDGDAAGQRAAMRAATRALPMLAPGKSLSFVHLPQNLDPDDVVRTRGKAFFEQLIQKPTSLVRRIWEIEKKSAHLDTPENKASLRERLLEKTFLINEREIRNLYRRELLDLYYEAIYPKKTGFLRQISHGTIDSESLGRLKYFVEHGSRESLCKAVISALARHPELIPVHLENLHNYHPRDDEIGYALDVFFEVAESHLDGAAQPKIILDKIAAWKSAIDYPFLNPKASSEYVSACLSEAIAILVEKPKIRDKLEAATERYALSMTDEDKLEQDLCRQRLREIDSRLIKIRELSL